MSENDNKVVNLHGNSIPVSRSERQEFESAATKIVRARLQELIDGIDSGRYRAQSAAVIMTTFDDSVVSDYYNSGESFVMLGAIEMLKRDFLNNEVE